MSTQLQWFLCVLTLFVFWHEHWRVSINTFANFTFSLHNPILVLTTKQSFVSQKNKQIVHNEQCLQLQFVQKNINKHFVWNGYSFKCVSIADVVLWYANLLFKAGPQYVLHNMIRNGRLDEVWALLTHPYFSADDVWMFQPSTRDDPKWAILFFFFFYFPLPLQNVVWELETDFRAV